MRMALRTAALVTVTAAATGLVPAATAGAASASAARPAVHAPAAQPAVTAVSRSAAVPGGARLWLNRFTGGAGRRATGASLAVSPDRAIVYVTGVTSSATGAPASDYTTVAYNSLTGATIWLARYEGLRNHPFGVPFIAVGPGGSSVFIAGAFGRAGDRSNYLVVAYNAVTGAQQWTATPASGVYIKGLTVSSEGTPGQLSTAEVLVTGNGISRFNPDYVTVSLNAASGVTLWSANTSFAPLVQQSATSIAVSANRSAVFVAGAQGMVAYDFSTGATLWQHPFKGKWRRAPRLAVSPDSSTVFDTSIGRGIDPSGHIVTNAYNASTGAILWSAFYNGPANAGASPADLAVSPDGSALFVTGLSYQASGCCVTNIVTVAYNAATGARLWTATYFGPGNGGASPSSLAVSPNGSGVFITGDSSGPGGVASENVTIGYDAATGAQLWKSYYREGTGNYTSLRAVRVSRDSQRVFIAGPGTGSEYLTLAYKA